MTKIIDLSKTIRFDKRDPWYMRIKIKHKGHAKSNKLIKWFIKLPTKLFPHNFEGWADDKIVSMGVHATTHIDAPWHYSPTVNGKRAKAIHEVPLEWLYGDGIVLDMSHKKDFEAIYAQDLIDEIQSKNLTIKKKDIVLIKTGRGNGIGVDYVEKGTGMTAEATLYLINLGVKVMGIDQWGWDLPLKYQAALAKKNKDNTLFWEGHLVGQKYEYLHMEQLTNLESLPSSGFKVAVFPLKIENASAAPARVVAIFDND